MKTLSCKSVVAVAGFVILSQVAAAAPILLNSTLTGDPRLVNPDNLVVNVSITGDTTSNSVNWVFDINSPLHPNIKLDEFYFNMLGLGTDYAFSNFSPVDWAVSTPASSAGGGNIAFLFEALDPSGQPNAADVTNLVNLTFTMTKTTGNFAASDFLAAASTCSRDVDLGCGQLGAHLQSLTVPVGSGQSDSGFALGNYSSSSTSSSTSSGPTSGDIPEPNSSGLVLLGLGAVLASFGMRRRASSAS